MLHIVRLSICFAFSIVPVAIRPAVAQGEKLRFEFSVASGSFLDNGDIDRMAAQATAIAVNIDQPYDASCSVEIARSGNVAEVAGLPILIDTAQQMSVIAGLPYDVFIVDQLSICGNTHSAAVAGCERSVGPMIVEAGSGDFMTLLHEVGHHAGLRHTWPTNTCQPTKPPSLSDQKFNNVMYCMRQLNRKVLTQADCGRLKSLGGAADMASPTQIAAVAPSEPQSVVVQLLSYGFAQGVPFEQLRALTAVQVDEVRVIVQGLDDTLWANAALALGVVGKESDMGLLVALAQRIAQIETPQAFQARTAVPEAIAVYLGAHPDDQPGWLMAYLLQGIDVGIAASRGSFAEAPLLARTYATATPLTGNLALVQGAVEMVNAQNVKFNRDASVQSALDATLVSSVANTGLFVSEQGFEQAYQGIEQVSATPETELLNRLEGVPIDPALPQVFRNLGLETSAVLDNFERQNPSIPSGKDASPVSAPVSGGAELPPDEPAN